MILRTIILAALATLVAVPRAQATTLLMIAADSAAFETRAFDAPDSRIGQGRMPTSIAVSSAHAISVLPEAATWTLMAIGFGLAGSVIRTRPGRTPNQL